ncbi:MAG: hypothetical protein JXA46_04015 [Dehalococcoidales bacterium]|nr:hypothetical protein [Dehalococcoidales bacterium]
MWLSNNPYRLLGIILAAAGILTAPVFYFVIDSIPLTAASISAVILGCTCLALADASPRISPQASQMLLRTGMENTASLLEELGINSRAIYLPARLRNGHAQALVPLIEAEDIPDIREKLPGRLLVRYGPDSTDLALAVATAGTVNLEILQNRPGPGPDEIESALNYILTGVLNIARGVYVRISGSQVEVRIKRATMGQEDVWYYRCLGSPVASIAAAVTSEALDKPVRIKQEKRDKKQHTVELEVLS